MSMVTGDPASMRAAAAQLRFRAETLGDVAATVDAGCAGMTFTGPAADTFHSNIMSSGSSLRGVAGRMVELADTLVREADRAGYAHLELPVFEDTALYARGVGESTDVVSKEMYSFADRGGRSVTLRPEGTAGVVRSVIEHGLDRGGLPVKLRYAGPFFRYERPQAGRYRQLQQVGIEAIGVDDPALDVALRSPCFYIGALGSRRTHAKRVARLQELGHGEAAVSRIHAPVGLDIGAASPAEIAVSVLAQMVRVLRQGA